MEAVSTVDDNAELISIIVPVYNRESLLRSCLDSLLCQTYGKIELILVDDGSSDGSLSVCRQYAQRDPRVCVIHQENSGPAAARNTGLDAARGQYIAFVDSDDRLHPKCIEAMLRSACKHHTGLTICEFRPMKREEAMPTGGIAALRTELLDAEPVKKDLLYLKEPIQFCWGKLWERSVIDRLRFQNYSFCEDGLFTLEALLPYRDKVGFIRGYPLYYYIQDQESITKTLSARNLLDSLAAADAVIHDTVESSMDIRKSAFCYCISNAFFAYLQAGPDDVYRPVRDKALHMIEQYRNPVMRDSVAPLKPRAACLLSCISMRLVRVVYRIISKGD